MTPTVPTTGGTIRQNVISAPVIQLRVKLPRYPRKRAFERVFSFFFSFFWISKLNLRYRKLCLRNIREGRFDAIISYHDDKIKWKLSLFLSLFIIFNNFTILTLSIEFLSMYSKELLLPFSRRKLILQRNRNVDH